MITVRVKAHRVKLNHSNYFIDEDGYAHIDFSNDSTVKDLKTLLQLNPFGKVIFINGVSCKDERLTLQHNDKIEIYQLTAGG